MLWYNIYKCASTAVTADRQQPNLKIWQNSFKDKNKTSSTSTLDIQAMNRMESISEEGKKKNPNVHQGC